MKTRNVFTLISCLAFAISLTFAQQIEVAYPNGLMAVAENNLPQKVYLAQRNVVRIIGEFTPKGSGKPGAIVQGSGFIESKSGYVITARHILVETVMNLKKRYGEQFYLDQHGIPQGIAYNYEIFAVVDTAASNNKFPLTVVGMSPLGTYADILVLKPLVEIPLQGLPLSDAIAVGESVYISGFTSPNSYFYNSNGEQIFIDLDIIKFNLEGKILAVLQNRELANTGVKKIFRMYAITTFGFSGGPVINKQGQVLGILSSGNEVFSHAFSSEDIKETIKTVK